MIVDTSALIAVIRPEPLADTLAPKILSGPAVMAAPEFLEAHMVLRRLYGEESERILDRFMVDLGIDVVAFTTEHAREATRAFDRFGKGRHPAGLNFGDCISYALSKVSGQPLLYVGDDFSKTDVLAA